MKLISKNLDKNLSGSIQLIPQETEDMWHTYNLLNKGDHLLCSTVRQLVSESSTGSTDKSSMRLWLTICIESIFFDTQACILQVNGRNIQENKFVKMGAYHTLDLELNRPFTITKEEWDIVCLERIDESCDMAKRAEIGAVLLQEGLANICLVTQSMTIVRQRLEIAIPKKRREITSDHDKGVKRFFTQVMTAIARHIDFSIVKVLILASPGFVKDEFYKFITENAGRTPGCNSIRENKSKIILAHSSSGHKQALSELLDQAGIQSQLSDTKYAEESVILKKFYRMLSTEPLRAFYGLEHVTKAADQDAVETLLVSDSLFRCDDIEIRKKYLSLIEKTRACGGKTFVLSSLHNSGEQLKNLTGIAAILHFPMPDIDEDDDTG